MSAKKDIMWPLYVLDYDYLKRDDTIIEKLKLKSEDYKEYAKNSKFGNSELLYAILQFWKENEPWEFVIHFSMNGMDRKNLLLIFEEELNSNKNIKATFGTSQLWFYIGMMVYKVWKIKVITNEKAMINKDLINFIAITMEELGLNKKDLKVTWSSTINPQIIETDQHSLKISKKSLNNSEVDIISSIK